MTLPNSLMAYQDCIELFDSAIEDATGVRLKVNDYDHAIHQRSRLHYCRKLHREENARIYDESNVMFGKSPYDAIVVRIKKVDEDFYLYLERNDKVRGEIESLSEIEAAPKIEIETELDSDMDTPRVARRV